MNVLKRVLKRGDRVVHKDAAHLAITAQMHGTVLQAGQGPDAMVKVRWDPARRHLALGGAHGSTGEHRAGTLKFIETAEERLERARNTVAQAARTVHDSAEGGAQGCPFQVNHDDMIDLRTALAEWKAATNGLLEQESDVAPA